MTGAIENVGEGAYGQRRKVWKEGAEGEGCGQRGEGGHRLRWRVERRCEEAWRKRGRILIL